MIEDDFTLIIQGPVNRNLITMCLLHTNINTIVSVWNDPMWTHPTVEQYLEQIKRPNLKIIVNDPPTKEILEKVYNRQNRYLQFLSTYNGLLHVKTKYSIKARSDEYYYNLIPLMQALLIDDKKLVTNDVFFRKIKYLKYHPSDHLICGQTSKMINLFYLLIHDCKHKQEFQKMKTSANILFVEQQIGMKWIEMNETNDQSPYNFPSEYEDVKKLMLKHFDMIDNHMLGEFCVVANSEKRIYINEHTYYDSTKDIQYSLDEL